MVGCGAFSLDCWNNANDGFFLWWRIEYPYRHLALLGGSSGICGRPANPWLLTFHSLSIYTRQQVLFSTTFFSNFTSPSEVIPLRQTLSGFGSATSLPWMGLKGFFSQGRRQIVPGSKNTGQLFFAGRKQRRPDPWSNKMFLAGLEDGIEGPAEEVGLLFLRRGGATEGQGKKSHGKAPALRGPRPEK